jgi:hypothetical protein
MRAVAVVEPWEIHSELALVSPEVCERARELLPERDPNGFLPMTIAVLESQPAAGPSLPVLRLAQTARSALLVVGAVVAFALIAQIFR